MLVYSSPPWSPPPPRSPPPPPPPPPPPVGISGNIACFCGVLRRRRTLAILPMQAIIRMQFDGMKVDARAQYLYVCRLRNFRDTVCKGLPEGTLIIYAAEQPLRSTTCSMVFGDSNLLRTYVITLIIVATLSFQARLASSVHCTTIGCSGPQRRWSLEVHVVSSARSACTAIEVPERRTAWPLGAAPSPSRTSHRQLPNILRTH